jgi:3-oxoacyl-[acyl-carrier-protein] synthase III
VQAAKPRLADAGLTAADIDLLIVATITPDLPMPATACIIQQKLGVPAHAACFDLNAACTGFIYALDTACAMLSSGRYKHALVIGARNSPPSLIGKTAPPASSSATAPAQSCSACLPEPGIRHHRHQALAPSATAWTCSAFPPAAAAPATPAPSPRRATSSK